MPTISSGECECGVYGVYVGLGHCGLVWVKVGGEGGECACVAVVCEGGMEVLSGRSSLAVADCSRAVVSTVLHPLLRTDAELLLITIHLPLEGEKHDVIWLSRSLSLLDFWFC